MAHDTTHGDAPQSKENKPKMALNSAFWFVLILALVFIAAVNFVGIMSHSEEHEGAGHEKTEQAEGNKAATQEGTEHHAEETAPAAVADSAHH